MIDSYWSFSTAHIIRKLQNQKRYNPKETIHINKLVSRLTCSLCCTQCEINSYDTGIVICLTLQKVFHDKEVSSLKRYSFYMKGISRLDTNLTWAVGASKRLVCCWLNLQWLFTQLMAHELKKKRMQSLGRRRRKNSVGVQENFWKNEKNFFSSNWSFNFLWNRQGYTTATYFE